MNAADEGWEVLPCGCQMSTAGEAFLFKPHDLACPNYLYVLAESSRQGKPVSTHLLPDTAQGAEGPSGPG